MLKMIEGECWVRRACLFITTTTTTNLSSFHFLLCKARALFVENLLSVLLTSCLYLLHSCFTFKKIKNISRQQQQLWSSEIKFLHKWTTFNRMNFIRSDCLKIVFNFINHLRFERIKNERKKKYFNSNNDWDSVNLSWITIVCCDKIQWQRSLH